MNRLAELYFVIYSDKQAQCITTTAHCPIRCVSLPHQEKIPPRPPLPRGILRKAELNKRYSMYETSEEDLASDEVSCCCNKKLQVKLIYGEHIAPVQERYVNIHPKILFN